MHLRNLRPYTLALKRIKGALTEKVNDQPRITQTSYSDETPPLTSKLS